MLINLTTADVRLNKRAKNSLVLSVGPVSGRNSKNVVERIPFPEQYELTSADLHLGKKARSLMLSAEPAGGGGQEHVGTLSVPDPFRETLKRAKKQGKW